MAISEMLERSLRPSCIIQCATVFGSHSYEIWWCREIKSPPSLNKINHCPMMSHVMQERLYRGDFCLCQSRRMGFSTWTSRADEKWIGHTGDLAIIGHHGHLNWKRFKRGNVQHTGTGTPHGCWISMASWAPKVVEKPSGSLRLQRGAQSLQAIWSMATCRVPSL